MSDFSRFEDFELVEGDTYRLTAPLVWHVGAKTLPFRLEIPAGTTFDLSVPWWLTWVLSRHDRIWLPAAAVHDVLLREGGDSWFAAAEFRRTAEARVRRAIKDGKIRLDWRPWPASLGVWLWTVVLKAHKKRP